MDPFTAIAIAIVVVLIITIVVMGRMAALRLVTVNRAPIEPSPYPALQNLRTLTRDRGAS
jgi:hypothetical protein